MNPETVFAVGIVVCAVLLFLAILFGGSRRADGDYIEELKDANRNLLDQRNSAEQERERALIELARRKGETR